MNDKSPMKKIKNIDWRQDKSFEIIDEIQGRKCKKMKKKTDTGTYDKRKMTKGKLYNYLNKQILDQKWKIFAIK